MKQRGFILPSPTMLMAGAIAVLLITNAITLQLYKHEVKEYAQFKSDVAAAQEQLASEAEAARLLSDRVTEDVSRSWAAAVAVLKRNPRIVRVSADCNPAGLRPLPGPASGLNGAGAQLQTDPAGSITAEQCEVIANNAVIDAATLTYLQDWAKRQSEIKP